MKLEISELMRQQGNLSNSQNDMKVLFAKINAELDNVCNNVKSTSLVQANNTLKDNISRISGNLDTQLTNLSEFMNSQLNSYQVTNEEATTALRSLVDSINGLYGNTSISSSAVAGAVGGASVAKSDTDFDGTSSALPTSSTSSIDVSKYKSNPSSGFVVTTDNKTFTMSSGDLDKLTAIVAAECDGTYDDALGVITTILNRCDDNWCVNTYGSSPLNQATAKGQFSVYSSGAYKKFTGGNASATVQEAVNDALNGVRNHNYMFFRSNGSTKYSNNMISPTGNRYGNH